MHRQEVRPHCQNPQWMIYGLCQELLSEPTSRALPSTPSRQIQGWKTGFEVPRRGKYNTHLFFPSQSQETKREKLLLQGLDELFISCFTFISDNFSGISNILTVLVSGLFNFSNLLPYCLLLTWHDMDCLVGFQCWLQSIQLDWALGSLYLCLLTWLSDLGMVIQSLQTYYIFTGVLESLLWWGVQTVS